MVDADEDERRVETHGAKRAYGHPVVGAVFVARRHDRDARSESAEHTAKGVRVDHASEVRESVSRREMPKTFQRYPSRITSRAGTKSPVTPTSRSARSFRAASDRAARLISGAAPTTAPIARST